MKKVMSPLTSLQKILLSAISVSLLLFFSTSIFAAKAETKKKQKNEVSKLRAAENKPRAKKDNTPPQIFLTLPKQVAQNYFSFSGSVQDDSDIRLFAFSPLVSLKNFDFTTGKFIANIELREGQNYFFILCQDAEGNFHQQEFSIMFVPQIKAVAQEKKDIIRKAPSFSIDAREENLRNENRQLKEDIRELRQELQNAQMQNNSLDAVPPAAANAEKIILRQIPASQLELPQAAGIYVMPFVGRSQTYRDAARAYFDSEDFSFLLASFNQKAERTRNEVLVPNVAFFSLLKNSKQEKEYQNIFRYVSSKFLQEKKLQVLQEQLLSYLTKNNMLKGVYNYKGHDVFEIGQKSAIVFIEQGAFYADFKNKNSLDEIIVVKISKKALLLQIL